MVELTHIAKGAPHWPLALSLALGACGPLGCEPDERTVPFKRGGDAGTGTPDAGAVAATPTPLAQVQSYEARPAQVTIDGHTLTIPEHHVLASLQQALNDDSLGDALLLVESPTGELGLRAYLGRPGGKLEAQTPVEVLTEPGCTPSSAHMQPLSAAHLAIEAELSCEAPAEPGGAPENPVDAPPPVPEGQAVTHTRALTLLTSIERTPRVLKRMELLPAPDARPDANLTLSLQGVDADADGHPDVQASLQLQGVGEAEPLRLQLTWLDRPAGLGRDAREPEKTLRSLADQALERVRTSPTDAIAIAERVRALHGLLCHGGATPMLRVDGVDGLPCGRSEARGRASAALVAGLAREARLLEALAARAALHDSPTQKVSDRDRERADAALDAFPGAEGYDVRRGAALSVALTPPVHASRLRFVDEDHIHVLGTPMRSLELSTGQLTPIAGQPSALLTSPDGSLAITDVVRTCEGYRLRILRAAEVVAGVAAGRAVAEPLITPTPAPAGAGCKQPLPRQAADDITHHVVHWGPDGAVVVRQAEVLLLPLDAAGAASGPARSLLGPDAAELRSRNLPGALAHTLPIATRPGVALLDLQRGTAALVRLEGGGATVTDLSLSPGGGSLVFLRDGFLWLAGPETPVANAPEGAPAPPATQARDAGPPSP